MDLFEKSAKVSGFNEQFQNLINSCLNLITSSLFSNGNAASSFKPNHGLQQEILSLLYFFLLLAMRFFLDWLVLRNQWDICMESKILRVLWSFFISCMRTTFWCYIAQIGRKLSFSKIALTNIVNGLDKKQTLKSLEIFFFQKYDEGGQMGSKWSDWLLGDRVFFNLSRKFLDNESQPNQKIQ